MTVSEMYTQALVLRKCGYCFFFPQTRVSRLNEQLESEKLELLSVVERKNQEIDRLNGMKINIFV